MSIIIVLVFISRHQIPVLSNDEKPRLPVSDYFIMIEQLSIGVLVNVCILLAFGHNVFIELLP